MAQKGPTMGGSRFFPDYKSQFSKEDHKIRFYTKNQQHSMSRLEDVSQNLVLCLKGTNLVQKGTKRGELDFSRTINFSFPKKDHKIINFSFPKKDHKISVYTLN